MYQYIQDPLTQKLVIINSKLGKKILKNYLYRLLGGASFPPSSPPPSSSISPSPSSNLGIIQEMIRNDPNIRIAFVDLDYTLITPPFTDNSLKIEKVNINLINYLNGILGLSPTSATSSSSAAEEAYVSPYKLVILTANKLVDTTGHGLKEWIDNQIYDLQTKLDTNTSSSSAAEETDEFLNKHLEDLKKLSTLLDNVLVFHSVYEPGSDKAHAKLKQEFIESSLARFIQQDSPTDLIPPIEPKHLFLDDSIENINAINDRFLGIIEPILVTLFQPLNDALASNFEEMDLGSSFYRRRSVNNSAGKSIGMSSAQTLDMSDDAEQPQKNTAQPPPPKPSKSSKSKKRPSPFNL